MDALVVAADAQLLAGRQLEVDAGVVLRASDEIRPGAPLDDGNVNPRQRQLARPPASAATVPNCAANNAVARRGRSAATAGVAPVNIGRTSGLAGTSSTAG